MASPFRLLLAGRMAPYRNLSSHELDLLEFHYELMSHWNRRMGLTSIRKLEEIIERHFCESLFTAAELPEQNARVADVGSGPGFPGIPIAILRSDLEVVLIEANQKKAVFLREATRALGNVRVLPVRAESIHGETFDRIVARAVRPEEVLHLLPLISSKVALLIGDEDVRKLTGRQTMQWDVPVRLPWGDRRTLLMGRWCSKSD
ncbi:MAG: 16S rRNA (guanine(527)-N(7))-methyltransferase RsmG [Bryobacterales bacterium]|nr:16S rRNA (guanine(527)-N(7))-methyltransferase RsmG [Bryobacterales bacterium]MEB2363648.1 16S rRNA (guanine(527)-N(7))-methyltransferase RsmG [Bryobacterales bacterium]